MSCRLHSVLALCDEPEDSSVTLISAELEAILTIPSDANLTQLDNTLHMFVTFTAAHHGESYRRGTAEADRQYRLSIRLIAR